MNTIFIVYFYLYLPYVDMVVIHLSPLASPGRRYSFVLESSGLYDIDTYMQFPPPQPLVESRYIVSRKHFDTVHCLG